MNTKREDLTVAEEQYLKHAAAAESEGKSLRQYYRSAGLSEGTLYSVRRGLIRKGVVQSKRRRRSRPISQAESFVSVRVERPRLGPVCRVQHPNGWVIECASWPESSWIAALMGEQT